jgi:hypothetical protein
MTDVYFEGGDHANLVHVSGATFQKLMAVHTSRIGVAAADFNPGSMND